MKFLSGLKATFEAIGKLWRIERKRDTEINRNPTEEELKDNKKGKLSIVVTIVSTIVYLIAFILVASSWQVNIGLGIFVLVLVLIFTPSIQIKAINLAKQQRKINGKGTTALILANVLPTIALVGGVLFFAFGGMYIFFKWENKTQKNTTLLGCIFFVLIKSCCIVSYSYIFEQVNIVQNNPSCYHQNNKFL